MSLFRAKPRPEGEPEAGEAQLAPLTPEELLLRARAWTKRAFWVSGSALVTGIVLSQLRLEPTIGLTVGIVAAIVFLGFVFSFKDKAVNQALHKDKWALPLNDTIRLHIAFISLILTVQYLAAASMGMLDALFYIGIWGLIAGGYLAWFGRWGRQPGPPSCTHCDYDLSAFDDLPLRCPECGLVLSKGFITDRPRARRPGLVCIGLVLGVTFCVGGWMAQFPPAGIYGKLPTGALLRMNTTDRTAFAELSSRTLSPDEHTKLADQLLDERSRDDYFWGDPNTWLGNELLNGSLNDEQRDRYLDHSLVISLDGPPSLHVGQSAAVRLRRFLSQPTRPLSLFIVFAGFEIGDDTNPIERQTRLLSDESIWDGDPTRIEHRGHRKSPFFEFTPTRPGTHTIRARCVLALFAPPSPRVQVTWDQRGKPVFTVEPVMTREVTLTHTIKVLP